MFQNNAEISRRVYRALKTPSDDNPRTDPILAFQLGNSQAEKPFDPLPNSYGCRPGMTDHGHRQAFLPFQQAVGNRPEQLAAHVATVRRPHQDEVERPFLRRFANAGIRMIGNDDHFFHTLLIKWIHAGVRQDPLEYAIPNGRPVFRVRSDWVNTGGAGSGGSAGCSVEYAAARAERAQLRKAWRQR